MKKIGILVTATLLACTVGATGVWAAGPARNGLRQTAAAVGCHFTDENGDGFCDNHADGLCRYDADGDGVCDNRVAGGCQGGGYGCRTRAGACRN